MRFLIVAIVASGCSGSHASPPPAPPPPPTDEPGPVDGKLHYLSDCSLTHPIARDPCSGATPSTRGLKTCDALGVKRDQPCAANAPSCYVERTCPDGKQVPQDFLICASQQPGRCLTRSSRQFKQDIAYLDDGELRDLARQVEALRLARYHYRDQPGGDERLGILTEDAAGAPFISDGGTTVDLYGLLAASIAAIQAQDHRLRALEQRLEACPLAGNVR